jgi:SNF2 family DNA or RNA helicase
MRRDQAFEAQARKQLERLGLEPVIDDKFDLVTDPSLHGQFILADDGTDIEAQMFGISMHTVPRLRKAGWIVEFDENYPFRVVEAEPEWYADVAPKKEQDWFDLELGIEIEGKRENLLPILVRMIRDPRFRGLAEDLNSIDENSKILVPLGDRGFVPLSGKRVRAILGTLIELYGDDSLGSGDRLSLSDWNAPRLVELDEALGEGTLRWAGGERLRELGRKLREFRGLQEVPLPPGFRGTLRAYQQEGLNWLQFLREYGLSGILADDMGLGKTVQILAHLLVEKCSGRMDRPSLVVAPTSAMTNWFREAERFVPDLRVLILQGSERKQHFARIAEYDLVLTTYPLLTRDAEVLKEQRWYFSILDEAQFVKNARTKSAQSAAGLNASHRLCVTGTPMENHLGELWSLFHILMPGLLGDRRQFGKLFRGPIEKQNDSDRRDLLVSRIRPFMLRRTKDEVALDLPPKTEMVRVVELQRGQRDLYESIRLAMHDKVREAVAKKGMARSTIVILDALLKLRQVCCDPRLLKIAQARRVRERAKLDALLEMLDELMSEGRRVLLFSQFTSMLSLIEPELTTRGFSWVKLTGKTKDRDTPIRRFQNGEVPLFLISLKAGGTALNLTTADTVIHYDPWWNPAVETQATDRAHRIGQDKPVFVYKLIAASSVEEKMVAMQERKRKLAQGIYGSGGKRGPMFTADDLESMFQPLG